MQVCIWRNNAGGLSWPTESTVLGNLLSLALTKEDSLDNGHANSAISRNSDNTLLLDTLFSRNYICSALLENLLCKKIMCEVKGFHYFETLKKQLFEIFWDKGKVNKKSVKGHWFYKLFKYTKNVFHFFFQTR